MQLSIYAFTSGRRSLHTVPTACPRTCVCSCATVVPAICLCKCHVWFLLCLSRLTCPNVVASLSTSTTDDVTAVFVCISGPVSQPPFFRCPLAFTTGFGLVIGRTSWYQVDLVYTYALLLKRGFVQQPD